MRTSTEPEDGARCADTPGDRTFVQKAPLQPTMPEGLADVALIDGKTAAAAASISLSKWHAEVAAGRAPLPVIRGPRWTRWRVVDVRQWLIQQAESGNPKTGRELVARATHASHVARAKRAVRGAR